MTEASHERPLRGLDAMPLGVRAIAFIVRHLTPLIASIVMFGALGIAAGMLLPRPYVDRAIVEVGLRFMNDPLEHPMVAAARLNGYLQKAASEVGAPDVGIEIEIRRAQKTNALTRLIEVRVEDKSADNARAILDRAVHVLVKEHAAAHDLEMQSLEMQLGRLEQAAARLQAQLQAGDEDVEELNAVLADTNKMIGATRNIATEVRLPKTRVVSHAVEPQPVRSRLPALALGGLLFGLFFGLALGAWRDAARSFS